MQPVGLKAEGVQWNLGELYAGPDDPRIEADLAEARRQAEAFAQTYRGKITALDGPGLARALETYERLSELEGRPSFYANLLFAADTQNQKAQQLVHRTREAATETSNLLVFFALDLIALAANALARDRRHLLAGELADHIADLKVLLGEVDRKIHGRARLGVGEGTAAI